MLEIDPTNDNEGEIRKAFAAGDASFQRAVGRIVDARHAMRTARESEHEDLLAALPRPFTIYEIE